MIVLMNILSKLTASEGMPVIQNACFSSLHSHSLKLEL